MHDARSTGISRRVFLGAAAAAPLSGLTSARRSPNVVLIVLDDVGYGDLGCYGQQKIRTPNIDRVAVEGRKFLSCYAGAASCAQSRAVLMMGVHTGHLPVRANRAAPLAAEDVVIPQVLKSAGYATGGFGKWGLGDPRSTGAPTKHGFDEFFGYSQPLKGKSAAESVAERSLDFIRRSKDAPFFLYSCYTLSQLKSEPAPYDKEPWTETQKTYAATNTKADACVGSVMSLLRELRLEHNTVVLITSDNGAAPGEKVSELFHSNGPLRGEKGHLYEGGIRVPMIVRWPGLVRPRTLSVEPWAFWDVLPTLAEIAGVQPGVRMDGFSILPLLRGIPQRVHQYMYWETLPADAQARKNRSEPPSQAVRMGQWKAIRSKPGSAVELYDVEADMSESRDVSAKHPEVLRMVQDYMKLARNKPQPSTSANLVTRGGANASAPGTRP